MADDTQSDTTPAEGGGKKPIVMIAIVAVVVMAASIGGTIMYMGSSSGGVAETAPAPEVRRQAAIYHNLRPAFIVNFLAGNKPRYLQAELTVMSRDQSVIKAVIVHTPLIRSEIVNLFADQDYVTLQTDEGKQGLRQSLKALIDEVLSREAHLSGVETVLLTNFVMQ